MIKLGLALGYSGKHLELPMPLIKHAEAAGFDSVWVSEAYGSDAVSPAAWILAQTQRIKVGTSIMQVPARTPAMTAMTAMTLSQLSQGRFILGLGASGPQVVEGWHGVAYQKPLTRMQEYITIVRKIMAREEAVAFDGEIYQLPWRGEGATGLGKPLKSIMAADTTIPIYTASITPLGLASAAEYADGVLPVWLSPYRFDAIGPHLAKGFARAGGNKSLANFDIAPNLFVAIGDDVDLLRQPIKQMMALYIGGMGAKDKNFYANYTRAMGYGEAAETIQNYYLAGEVEAAIAAVPDALVDETSLLGPEAVIRERAERWREAAAANEVGTLMCVLRQPEAVDLLADIFLR
ncbi:LLM class F420-dependent oxidoreductase [Halioxenophilus sp. WMMB6]|uniref:LLM class F420-dependent oxidoreductase n=1 Tax=Halioxenophilus sp. WMMB6 TaxID=3073815 RepID=UPI00295F01E8|nr:LLM class F420-dependent oxidoreductase [Halioxenophilus sp. WMMB6]